MAVLAIVRCGSFRAAALDLGMSTTAVSNAVGKLERQFDVRLCNRTAQCFAHLRPPDFRRADQTSNWWHQESNEYAASPARGSFRCSAHQCLRHSGARDHLADRSELPQRYPQVHIDIVAEKRLVDVVAAGFDLGVRSADLVPIDAIAIPLGKERRIAVAASLALLENRAVP